MVTTNAPAMDDDDFSSKFERGVSPHEAVVDFFETTGWLHKKTQAFDGPTLHQSVPKDMWCVTKYDLRELRRKVIKAIKDGTITPTERDPFDPKDFSIGPNIYTVTEQYIKPKTHESGDVSWALMRHPNGLPCDLFITHAWSEGIFEFIDKVVFSWPIGAKNAYCCMLSNPQNLDISALISDPTESPFYHALKRSSHMMVVPNHRASIYTRLWCVFEAHLAYVWGKQILTASHSPHYMFYTKVLGKLVLCWVLGIVAAVVVKEFEAHDTPCVEFTVDDCPSWCVMGEGFLDEERLECKASLQATLLETVSLAFFLAILCVSTVMDASAKRFWVNAAGITLGGFICGMWYITAWQNTWGPYYDPGYIVQTFCAAVVFPIAESDRMRLGEFHRSIFQLTRDFKDVREASCSNEKDKQSIHKVIGDTWPDVQITVQILIEAGMSTPSIRKAVEKDVRMRDAAFSQLAPCFLTWMGWVRAAVHTTYASDGDVSYVLGAATTLMAATASIMHLQ
eukprot:TRINITY_DN16814_c0_g1_i4.p1 TRINITY_DN16814_c0_g1~~TRINITY_DN16814_c0_g1_i4.p1  ORF type:complete len:509 (-),score=52.05 TRINITY_DN16814_c0_g1_i4:778-2304(-)